ncbi:MAG: cation-transporting P-type ATPase, partial [Actinobacteria bacterium]
IGLDIVLIAIVVFIVGIAKGNDVFTMLLIAVALAVAAIPEGLPAIVTITLAIGVQYMAKEKAIVRRLHAVETLGSTNYIATDKTGTLTLNEMSVSRLLFYDKLYIVREEHIYDLEKEVRPQSLNSLMLTAILANDSRKQTEDAGYIGEPTELALVQAGSKLGFDKGMLDYKHERIDELPFEPERKEMTTVNKFEGRFRASTKGAVEVLLNQSDSILDKGQTRPLTEKEKQHLISVTNQEAASGYRMLGFAYKDFDETPEIRDLEKNMTFVGMTGLLDPPRPEVAGAIQTSKKAGINIAMVTGDHLLTAQKIAEEVGLKKNENSLEGRDLNELSSHELAEKVEKINIYARVDPAHKVKIVEALKEKGYIVAVTGDGVNDAPALNKADIGIAMGITGTDVSKEASDMILADDNFATIVKAIRLGRSIFDNIQKFISFLLSANVSEVLTIFLGILLFPKGVILLVPIQILWINLVTDAFPALALGVDPAEKDVMERGPRKREEGILTGKQATRITTEGIILTAAALSVFSLALLYFEAPLIKAQTMVFTTLVLIQLIHAFNYRSSKTIFSSETFLNRYLIFAFLGSLALQLIVVYIPFLNSIFNTVALGFSDWLLILVASFIAEILIDLVKVRFFSKQDKQMLL